jgi:large subunit ribosomal protein L17
VRHGKKGRQLSRDTKHRWALFRNLVTSLLDCERIETTEQKAKEIRGYADRMITLGKKGDLDARRRALSFIRNKAVVSKLFSDVAGRFRDRNGGYTRMIKTRKVVRQPRSNLTHLRAGKQGQPRQSLSATGK